MFLVARNLVLYKNQGFIQVISHLYENRWGKIPLGIVLGLIGLNSDRP